MIDVNETYYFDGYCGDCMHYVAEENCVEGVTYGRCLIDDTPTFSNSLSNCVKVRDKDGRLNQPE